MKTFLCKSLITRTFRRLKERWPIIKVNIRHAFMAHLRIEDYAEMKIKAMKLFQKYKKIRYLYWQVMCGYFQAVSQKNNPKINLTIARKVFEKARIP